MALQFGGELTVGGLFEEEPGHAEEPCAYSSHGRSFLRNLSRSKLRSCKFGCLSSNHSYRSATIGSTDAARRAGMALATSATSVTPNSALRYEIESPGMTPKSIERISWEPAMARGTPTATPATLMSKLSRKTIQRTCKRCAPNAMRTPISEVRRLTR